VCSPVPKVPDEKFQRSFILIAGIIHNVFALLVFIGYFMANHPQLPSSRRLFSKIRLIYFNYSSKFSCGHFLSSVFRRVAGAAGMVNVFDFC